MNQLSLQQQRYVQERLTGKTCAAAARAAGYGERYARYAAGKIEQNPLVKAEIEKARQTLCANTEYTAERLIGEILDDIQFAKQTKNSMAVMQGRMLIAKITGLIIEKFHVKHDFVDIAEALAEARSRSGRPPIDVECTPVPRPLECTPPNPFAD